MTHRRRFFLTTALGVALVGLLALLPLACDRGGGAKSAIKPKVVFITTGGVSDFWRLARVGAEAGAKDFEADVEILTPQTAEEQGRMVRDAAARNVAGVAVSPMNGADPVGLIDAAAARTRVVTYNVDAPGSKRLCFVGADDYDAGRLCGKLAKDALPSGGSVVIVGGRIEERATRRRRQGVIDELLNRPHDPEHFDKPGPSIEGDKYEIVETMLDPPDGDTAGSNALEAMGKHKRLGVMVGLFDAPAVLDALGNRAGKDVQVVAFDEADPTLQAIRDGRCYGTVVRSPYRYGYESVRIVAGLVAGDQNAVPANGVLNVAARSIKKDDVDAFWSEKNARLETDR